MPGRKDRPAQRVDDRRCDRNDPAFADAANAQRIGGWQRRNVIQPDARRLRRRRDQVVRKAAGQQLRLLVIQELRQHRAADAIRDRADDLAFDDRLVQHDAGVVHDQIVDDLILAGSLIERDLGDVDR